MSLAIVSQAIMDTKCSHKTLQRITNLEMTTRPFLISAENIILVKHTEVFNSNELKKDIPKDLRTFRYSPYISPKSNLGSQKTRYLWPP